MMLKLEKYWSNILFMRKKNKGNEFVIILFRSADVQIRQTFHTICFVESLIIRNKCIECHLAVVLMFKRKYFVQYVAHEQN